VRENQQRGSFVTYITPYLAMLLAGFAAFAFGQLRTVKVRREDQ
jgi:hypothetical protein